MAILQRLPNRADIRKARKKFWVRITVSALYLITGAALFYWSQRIWGIVVGMIGFLIFIRSFRYLLRALDFKKRLIQIR